MSAKKIFIFITIFVIQIHFSSQNFENYPEDISSLDYLVYSDKEFHLASFYYVAAATETVKYDYRNGIKIYPFVDCLKAPPLQLSNYESSTLEYTHVSSDQTFWEEVLPKEIQSGNCDAFWTSNGNIMSTVVPALETVVKNYITSNLNYSQDVVCAIYTLDKLPKGYKISSNYWNKVNYDPTYYVWMYGGDDCYQDKMTMRCNQKSNPSRYNSEYSLCQGKVYFTVSVFYQEAFKFKQLGSSGKYKIVGGTSTCNNCELISSNDRIYLGLSSTSSEDDTCQNQLHYQKVTIQQSNLFYLCLAGAANSCNPTITNDCPPGFYCANNKCVKCHGRCKNCSGPGENDCTECSPFSKDWKTHTDCNLEYYDMQTFSTDYTFPNLAPIKTRRATVSFWLYVNDPSASGTNVAHIVIEDQMVITITFNGSDVINHCTVHHQFHSRFSTVLEQTKLKSDFDKATTVTTLPYRNWKVSSTINSINKRWFYTRCGVNYNSNEYYILTSYKKSFPYVTNNICDKTHSSKGTMPFPNTFKSSSSITSDFHYRKYYRPSETITIKILNISNMGTPVFMRDLYVFSEFLPVNLENLQYFRFHKFLNAGEFPEFLLAVPFDEFTSISPHILKYYVSPSKITNANTFDLGTASTNFLFPINFYRLNLMDKPNLYWNTRDMDPTLTSTLTCSANTLYCSQTETSFLCDNGYYLNSDFTCKNTCDNNLMIGPGLGTFKKGICTKICDNCTVTGLQTFTCKTGYVKIFDQCFPLTDEFQYMNVNERGGYYYSSIFNLPPVYIKFNSISSALELRNYYFEIWWLHETNSDMAPKNGVNHFIYTNSFQLYHNDDRNTFTLLDVSKTTQTLPKAFINIKNWNKFTFKITSNEGKLFINNIFNSPITFTSAGLDYMLFCHNDSTCPVGNTIRWSGGFYKNLRIWDGDNNYINDKMVFNYQIYDNYYWYKIIETSSKPTYVRPKYIAISFQFNLINMESNILRDAISGNSVDVNSAISGLSSYNSENMQIYNYSSRFDYITLNNFIQSYVTSTDSGGMCNSYCMSCWGDLQTNCNTVKFSSGYIDNSSYTPFPSSYKSYIVYVSPTLSNEDVKFIDMSLGNKITVSFFVKIIGFSDHPISDIFYYDDNIKLRYDHGSNKMELYLISQDRVIASIDNFNTHFGSYVHISLAYQYDLNRDGYYPPMMNLNVNRENVKLAYDSALFSSLNIQKITIPKTVFAVFARLYMYKDYLIGTYGYETNKYYSSNFPQVTPHKKLINEASTRCISGSDLSPSIYHGDIICYLDYDPIFNMDNYATSIFTSPDTPSKLFTGTTTFSDCSITSNTCYETCYDTNADSCSCRSNSYNFWLFRNDNKNKCKNLDYLDFASFDSVSIPSVKASSVGYTLGFWFYMYQYKPPNEVSYDIFWDKQLRISFNFSITILEAACYPAYDSNSTYSEKSTFTFNTKEWKYIRCSASRTKKKYLLFSNTDASFNPPKDFTSFPSSVPDSTSLIFQDNTGHDSWGTLFFSQIRLWGCYSCFNTNIYKMKIEATFDYYEYLNHLFEPTFNDSYTITDITGNAPPVSAKRRSNFFGYNVAEESDYQVKTYCSETDNCMALAKISDFEDMIFKDIPVSLWGRYTIEFWIYVSDSSKVDKGVNLIWENHIAISIIVNENGKDLKIVCFPQDYLSSPLNKSGASLNSFISSTKNYDSISYVNSNGTWIWVRCGVSWDMMNFYLAANNNINSDKTLLGETLYTNKYNEYPFRYFFKENELTKLTIQNASMNQSGTDIYVRNIYLFDNYIPRTYIFKNTLLTNISSSIFRNLIFSADFLLLSIGINSLDYKTSLSDDGEMTTNIAASKTPSYDFDLEIPTLCDPVKKKIYDSTSKKCIDLKSCDENAYLCYDENKPILCKGNYFLDTSSGTCNSECPNGEIRSPGTKIFNGICNYTCDSNHQGCKFDVNQMQDYPTNLLCQTGYTRVGYLCLPSDHQEKSSLYFNSCYKFPSVFNTFDDTINQNTASGYILEFWFKKDMINSFCLDPTDSSNKYLFYAFPHTFYENKSKFYYQNELKADLNGELKYNQYEWNPVVVRVQVSGSGTSVYLFTKLNLITPNLSFTGIDPNMNLNIYGLAFCTGNGICNPGGKGLLNISWSAAFYKSIKIYDNKITTNILQDFLTKNSTLIYYSLTTITSDLNVLQNLITKNGNNIDYYEIYTSGVYLVDDKNILYNSSSGYDWGENNPGKTIISQTNNGDVTSHDCYATCRSCYSSSQDDCYGCNEGYTLVNNKCLKATGYYLQVPTESNKMVSLNIKNPVNITKANAITLTFWIKFYGVTSLNQSECPIIIRFSQISNCYLCYEIMTDNLLFKYNDEVILLDTTFKEYSGQWTFVAISNFYGGENQVRKYFPDMLSLYILNNEVPRDTVTTIPEPGLNIDNIDLGNDIIALFGEMRFYNNFIIQPYGFVTSLSSTNTQDLILTRALSGTSSTSCLTNADVEGGNASTLQFRCLPDYNGFLDLTIRCNNNDKFLMISNLNSNTCTDCNTKCKICSGDESIRCTCNFKEGTNWLRRDDEKNVIYCDQTPYVDFALFNTVKSSQISISNTDEYTLEMWIYIYSYNEIEIGFDSHEITWDLHLKAKFFNEDGKLNMKCYPVYDSTKSDDSQESFIEQTGLSYFKWNYIQCSTSLKKFSYYVNDSAEQKLTGTYPSISRVSKSYTSLTVGPSSNAKENFGFIFIREIKLWSIYNLRELHTKCYVSYPLKLSYLLNYFPMLTNYRTFKDYKTDQEIVINKSPNFIGYNIIDISNNKDIDHIKFNLDDCSYLEAIPNKGYYHYTNFLFKCTAAKPSPDLKYKFYYSFSTSFEEIYYTITDYDTTNEVNFSFGMVDLNEKVYNINIFCDVKDNTNTILTASDRIILYINNLIDEFSFKTNLINLDLNKNSFSEEELLKRSVTLGSLASNYYQIISVSNRTHIAPTINRESVLIQNPECTPEFCNERGECVLIDHYLTCLCNTGFYGENCQLNQQNKDFLNEKYSELWNLITFNNKFTGFAGQISRTKLLSISWVISGATKFITDDGFYDNFFNLLSYVQDNMSIELNKNYDIFFEIYDKLVSFYNSRVNSMKINNNYPNLNNLRASNLNETQSSQIKRYISLVKSAIENLASNYMNKAINQNLKEVRPEIILKFYSFEVFIKQFNAKDFNFLEFFKERYSNYEGLFDAKECLNEKITNNNLNPLMWMSFIYYKVNPFVFDMKLFENTTSLLNVISIYDIDGKKLDIKDCINSPIKIYFPIYNYNQNIVEYINYKKSFFYPNNTIPLTDDLFTKPVYIFANGTVSHLTIDERKEIYHRRYNLTCKYLNSENQFITDGLTFDNITDDYFLTCNSTHLSSFMLFTELNDVDYYIDGYFFYIKYPRILRCWDNYLYNYCSLLILIFFAVFFIFVFILLFSDYSLFKKEGLLEFIKFQILKEQRRYTPDEKVYDELIELNRKTPEYGERINTKEKKNKDEINSRKTTEYVERINTKEKTFKEEINKRGSKNTTRNPTEKDDLIRFDNSPIRNNFILRENRIENKNNFRDSDGEIIGMAKLEYIPEVKKSTIKVKPEEKGLRFKAYREETKEENLSSEGQFNNELFTKSSFFSEDSFVEDQDKDVTTYQYLIYNMSYRHFYIGTFTDKSSFNPRYKKFILLFTLFSIMMIMNTLCYTINQTFNTRTLLPNDITIPQMIIYALIVAAASNLVMIPIIPLFRISRKKRDRLYSVLLSGKQLELLHSWELIRSLNRKISIIGIILNIILMLFSFYFLFNYCAIMFSMQLYIIFGLCAAILADCFIFEIFMELLCCLLFRLRRTCLRCFYKMAHGYREFKCLM